MRGGPKTAWVLALVGGFSLHPIGYEQGFMEINANPMVYSCTRRKAYYCSAQGLGSARLKLQQFQMYSRNAFFIVLYVLGSS